MASTVPRSLTTVAAPLAGIFSAAAPDFSPEPAGAWATKSASADASGAWVNSIALTAMATSSFHMTSSWEPAHDLLRSAGPGRGSMLGSTVVLRLVRSRDPSAVDPGDLRSLQTGSGHQALLVEDERVHVLLERLDPGLVAVRARDDVVVAGPLAALEQRALAVLGAD